MGDNTSRCEEINEQCPGLLKAILAAHQLQTDRQKRTARRRKVRAEKIAAVRFGSPDCCPHPDPPPDFVGGRMGWGPRRTRESQ